MTVAKRNRVTLADVAKAANVSRSTASRALNNSPRISRETTARIKKIADSMGFIPNAQGRALAVGRNETIAILITEPLDELFDDPTYAMFISGITEKLSESSYLPVLLQASTDFERHRVQQHLERRSFDAVIDISPYANNYLLEEMYKLRIPCVMLGQMEDRTVPAQRDDQAGVLQLRQQRLDGQIPKSARFGGAEGGTDCRLKPQLLQKLDCCLCGPHAMVTIRVRAEDNRSGIHYTAPSPCSFKVWWDSSTSASRSNVSIWAAPFCRKPRYSILPSGPRIGE